MVPAALQNYFLANTQTSAALVGLLFLAVSIAPQQTVTKGAPAERRTVALSTYTSLLNAFFLSQVAILPQGNLGWAALILSGIGLTNQGYLAWDLFRHTERIWFYLGRGAFLIAVGLLLYGWELYDALLLLQSPSNSTPISALAVLLLGLYAFSLARAWQLLGGSTHGIGEWLSPLHTSDARQSAPTLDQSLSEPSGKPGEPN